MATPALPPPIVEVSDYHAVTAMAQAERRLRAIAREIGRDILDIDTIRKHYDVYEVEWNLLQENPHFQRMVGEERATWASSMNARERVDLKSLIAYEESILAVAGIVNDPAQPAAARVAGFTALQKGSGIGIKNDGPIEAGSKVMIQINMGGTPVVQEHVLPPKVIEGELVNVV